MTSEDGTQPSSIKLWLRHADSAAWERKPHRIWFCTAHVWLIWELIAFKPTLDRLSNHGLHSKWRHSCWNPPFPTWKHKDYINLVPRILLNQGDGSPALRLITLRLICHYTFPNYPKACEILFGKTFQSCGRTLECGVRSDWRQTQEEKKTRSGISRLWGPRAQHPSMLSGILSRVSLFKLC